MKKFIIIPILAVLLFLFVAGFPVLAKNNDSEKKIVTVGKDEVLDKDFFAVGDVIEIYGTINGDAYLAGGEITVKGSISGDLLAAGGNIELGGTVGQNVRLFGGQINVTGEVGKTFSFLAGNVNIADTASIAKALVGAGGNVNLRGSVADYIMAAAGNVTIGSQVGDVDLAVGTLRLTPEAIINGHLNYYSENKASFASADQVIGETNYHQQANFQPPQINKDGITKVLISIYAFFKLASFISILLVGILLISLMPKFNQQVEETINQKPWLSLLWGVLFTIITPIIAVILAITLIGLPLALTLFSLYMMILFFSRIFIMFWLGKVIAGFLQIKGAGVWAFIFGSLIYMLLSLFLPVVGSMATGIGTVIGLGAALLAKRNIYLQLRQKNLI